MTGKINVLYFCIIYKGILSSRFFILMCIIYYILPNLELKVVIVVEVCQGK